MVTAVRNALRVARRRANNLRGVSVTYRRVADSTESTITMVPAQTETEATGADGVVITTVLHDWLVNLADMPAVPEAGDQIVFENRRFELVPLSGERCWEWHDQWRDSYRLHSIEVLDVTVVVDEAIYANVDLDTYGNIDGDEYGFQI